MNDLEDVYRTHRPRIRALCLRMTGSPAAADDLAQEVFVRALRSAGEFRGEAAAGTWLYSIARNLCVDHLRKEAYGNARRARAAAEGAPTGRPGGAAMSPAVADDRVEVLEEGLARLSIDDREVVVLAHFMGLGSRRIGEILECSAGAARVRLHRALVRLRRECLEIAESRDGLRIGT